MSECNWGARGGVLPVWLFDDATVCCSVVDGVISPDIAKQYPSQCHRLRNNPTPFFTYLVGQFQSTGIHLSSFCLDPFTWLGLSWLGCVAPPVPLIGHIHAQRAMPHSSAYQATVPLPGIWWNLTNLIWSVAKRAKKKRKTEKEM